MWPTLLLPLLVIAGTDTVETIDRDWLSRHGPAPFLLDQARTTYLLKTDLRSPGTAIVVDAPDVVLDLGGHTIIFGASPPLTVPNGGFEEGSGREVPGWDLSGAPAAALAANTHFLFGKQVLRLQTFQTKQRLVSAPIAVPATTHTHAATITPAAGDYRTTLTLTVVDADSGQALGQGKSNNVERGISAVAHFQPGTSRAVRLIVEAVPGDGRTDNLDLDQATVTATYDYGILATNAWTGEIAGWSNLERSVGKLRRQVSRLTVRNGTIVQGSGCGMNSSPLYMPLARGVTVENVETLTTGVDTTTLDASRAQGPIVVQRCKFRHDVNNVTDRGKLVATLRLAAINGAIDVENNELTGVPQVGILLDGANSGAPIRILHNQIQQQAVVTNGYALVISGSSHFEVADNRIVAANGRGIDIDSYRTEPVEIGCIHHNYVEVREGLNREYWNRLETRALRLRNTVDRKGPHRDLLIQDNTFIASAGADTAQKAFAVRVTYQNGDGSMTRANVRLERNVLRAVATSPDAHASALALDGFDAGVDLNVSDNVLESNDTALTLADSEGPVNQARIVGNTFRKITAGSERPFHAIHAGFWEFAVHGVAVIGPKLENHDVLDVEWAGTGAKDLAIGHLLSLTVRQGDGPASGAEVSIEDRQGKVFFSGKTGPDGELRAIPLVQTQYRQTTADPRKIAAEQRGPFRVRVTSGGKTVSEEVVLDKNREIDIHLPAR
jgi:hypothetical protein